jgi:hypothetical protein
MNMMQSRRQPILYRVVCLLFLFGMLLPSFAPLVPAYAASEWAVLAEASYPVAPGVTHTARTLNDGQHVEAVYDMEVDPANPLVGLAVTSPRGKVAALDTVRNEAAQIDREGNRVVGGFNMDFFNTDPTYAGIPNGLQITDGEVITAPGWASGAILAVQPDKSFAIVSGSTLTATVGVSGGETRALAGLNRPRTASATNQIYLDNSRFSTTTKSAGTGVEVVIAPTSATASDKFLPGQTLTGTVESVVTTTNNAIPAGKWVLSASGTQGDWAKANLTPGQNVEVKLTLSNGLATATQAVSGGVLLVQNGLPTATALADNVDRHPRTFVGLKDGKLRVIAFDGRQPTWSDGVTLAEGAQYLASLGLETAFNADGGGSTTYAARVPGDDGLSIVNRPSDGFERAVSNALQIVSTAPKGTLSYLVPQPKGPLHVLAGSTVPFSSKGQDQYYGGVTVDPFTLSWAADDSVGTIDAQGRLTAGTSAGQGKVTVSSGAVKATVDIEVVTEVASLDLAPNPAIVNPGAKQTFTVQGHDANGREILLSPDRVIWSTEGGIGEISTRGELTAANGTASGKVIAVSGNAKAEAVVNVGKPPVILEDFEDITDLSSSSARANSVALTLASRANPVRYGTHSAKLAYDFTGQSGTSAAYVNFKDAAGVIGRPIEGRPTKIGLWVYGDGKNHWLRGQYQEGNGTKKSIDFTPAGGLNWVGWKYVETDVPQDAVLPLQLRQIYVVETSTLNKNAGAIYFDNLRAVYSDTGEDLVGPTFSNYAPAAGKKIYQNTPLISAVVHDDGTGVDGGSLSMLVDGKAVAHQYDASTGKVSYQVTTPLADGEHSVQIDGEDKAANPALPRAEWKFTVYTGPDADAPTLSVIAPMDGTTTRTDQARLAVVLKDEYTGIDADKTHFEVDGAAVDARWDAASGTVSFTPQEKWTAGSQHTAKVTATDKGNNNASVSWSFTIGAPLGQPQNPEHFQISVIGDGGYYTAGQGQTAADILLREQIARINQEPSELVGYTGDIVENDTAANYATALQNMNLFHAPYVASIGNHEISGTNSRANYQNTFGEPTYFYDYGNTRIIGLDSASGRLSNSDASQWSWLQETLDHTTAKNVLLVMHIPPDEIAADGHDFHTGHGFQDAQEAAKFYNLLGAWKAAHPDQKVLVLSGDLHAYEHKQVQGVDYIITGGGGKATHVTPQEGGFYHYVNVKIDGDQLTWDVIPLLDSITFTATAETLEVGKSAALKADGRFMTSSNPAMTLPVAAPFKVEWTSSDPKVATVDGQGNVTAVAPGLAEITVKSGWREATTMVNVPTRMTSTLPDQLEQPQQNKFEMTTSVHPDDEGAAVKLCVTLLDPAARSHIDLKHQEADGEYHKLVFDEQGVALLDSGTPLTTQRDLWMLKFDAPGTYAYKVEWVKEDGTILAGKTERVTVVEKVKGNSQK